MGIVRLFLEVSGVGRAIDFSADGALEFLHLSETLMFADEPLSKAVLFADEWRRGEVHLELRIVDAEQQFFRLDWCRGFLVAAEDTSLVPRDRTNDVIVFDAASDQVIPINPLACSDPARM